MGIWRLYYSFNFFKVWHFQDNVRDQKNKKEHCLFVFKFWWWNKICDWYTFPWPGPAQPAALRWLVETRQFRDQELLAAEPACCCPHSSFQLSLSHCPSPLPVAWVWVVFFQFRNVTTVFLLTLCSQLLAHSRYEVNVKLINYFCSSVLWVSKGKENFAPPK